MSDNRSLHLILGGARSGKSRLAENVAKQFEQEYTNAKISYVATAQALDEEMSQRINKHQQQRPNHWQLFESPFNLANTINDLVAKAEQPHCILVDCLTLWLSNALCDKKFDKWQSERDALINLLDRFQGFKTIALASENSSSKQPITLILVSNEVGHGIVPMGELSRNFVDQTGWLHQDIAEKADQVDFVIAGIPLALKAQDKDIK